MIYTVTFNPALDYVIKVNDFKTGGINRVYQENLFFGGKGINVSYVLREHGYVSTALGFTAGFTGEAIENGLREQGIHTDFIRLSKGMSRINVKMKSQEETEINGQGPDIPKEALNQLFCKLDKLKEGDVLILAGSIPVTLPEDIYEQILMRLEGKGILCVVDATKKLLFNVLKYKPFLVKPNNHELGELFGVELTTEEDIIFYAKKLKNQGATNVLVSMAEKGALLVTKEGTVYKVPAPKGVVVNSVGAGDSMVAGFVVGYLEKQDYEYALKLGIASGSATAFSEGLAIKEDIDRMFNESWNLS